jgi:hypothetical protein
MGGPDLPEARKPGLVSTPGAPENPSGKLGGIKSWWTDYFGDHDNFTTLNHRIYMDEIYPNVTIADLMDLNGPVICSEYYESSELETPVEERKPLLPNILPSVL